LGILSNKEAERESVLNGKLLYSSKGGKVSRESKSEKRLSVGVFDIVEKPRERERGREAKQNSPI